MKKTFITFLIFTVLILKCLYSSWYDNIPNSLEQPDGTIVDVLYSGDNIHQFPHDENGFTIIQDPITGYWCWAIASEGLLESTGYPIHLHSPESLGINPYENISEERYLHLKKELENSSPSRNNIRSPSVGTINSITVFIRFATDTEFNRQVSFFDSMLNYAGENVSSMYQYFWDASFQQLEVFSPMFPIATGNNVVSYQSPHPRGYFQPYSTTNTIGYLGGSYGWERMEREHALLRDAIEYIRGEIPTSLVIDSDGDGYVDNVNFVIRGGTGAWADLLWPHRWSLTTYDVMIHGKQVMAYNVNIENHLDQYNVSVLAHEFAHSFGLPDLYRYQNSSTNRPIGFWCLMASNSNPPQSISAYMKNKYTDWILPIPTIVSNGTYTLYPLTSGFENIAYRINSPNSTSEHFVVEYRNNTTGLTDSTLPGSGLLVYRARPSINGNADGPTDELYVYRHNGSPTSEGTVGTALYSSAFGRTHINDISNPSSFLSNGQPGGLFIYDIGNAEETISFSINVEGANPDLFNESFEEQILTNYDWINDPLYPWEITPNYASDGVFSLASGSISHDQSTRLELNIICDTGFFQFMYRSSTENNGDFLRFYINNREMLSISGNVEWKHFSTPVMAGTYKLTWIYEKNGSISHGEDKVWIDQIGFPDITENVLYPASNLIYDLDERTIEMQWDIPFKTHMPNPPTLLGYIVYQNNVPLNNEAIKETAFVFSNPHGGSMIFHVTAEYQEGFSIDSNSIQISLPILPPSNLTAEFVENGIELNWEYPIESVFLLGFRVVRNGQNITIPILEPNVFTYVDSNAQEGENIYRISAIFSNPSGMSPPSNEVSIIYTDLIDTPINAYITELIGNYPNPFNPETTIHFTLKNDTNVKIDIFNIRGAWIATVKDEIMIQGRHSVVWDASNMASGVYFYRLDVEGYQAIRRMVLVK